MEEISRLSADRKQYREESFPRNFHGNLFNAGDEIITIRWNYARL